MMARFLTGRLQESAAGGRAATFGSSMMSRSWTGRLQESATGGKAATLSGSRMARSWTGRSQESATGGRAATLSSSMMARSWKIPCYTGSMVRKPSLVENRIVVQYDQSQQAVRGNEKDKVLHSLREIERTNAYLRFELRGCTNAM
jgi:hypothetical protein